MRVNRCTTTALSSMSKAGMAQVDRGCGQGGGSLSVMGAPGSLPLRTGYFLNTSFPTFLDSHTQAPQ